MFENFSRAAAELCSFLTDDLYPDLSCKESTDSTATHLVRRDDPHACPELGASSFKSCIQCGGSIRTTSR
jgi:hypothetical protein